MNKLRLLTLLFTALFFITLSSCSKDDDVEPGKRQLLTAHEWVGSAVYSNGYKAPDDGALEVKSIKLNFKEDRTFTATYRYNGVPQTEEGLWDLKDNNTKINFPFLNQPGEDSDVMRLTDSNFDVSTVYTLSDGTKQSVELRFVK